MYYTYQFIALYWAHLVGKNMKTPVLNKNFVFNVMRIVSKSSTAKSDNCKGKTLKLKNKLNNFYESHFKAVLPESDKPLYDCIRQMLDYESTSIITCIENHIEGNFKHMLNRYINIVCDKNGLIDEINKRNDIKGTEKTKLSKKVKHELFLLKNDILNHYDKCDNKYNNIKTDIRKILNIKNKKNDKSLFYYVTCKPFDYLEPLMRMSIKGEKIMEKRIKNSNNKEKLFNIIKCFPLRTQITSKHVKFDTTQIIYSLMGKNKTVYTRKISKYHDYIWGCFFRTRRNYFKKRGYRFNNMISTDGISCTISFIRNDLYNPSGKNMKKVRKPKNYKEEYYVEDLTEDQKDMIRGMNIAGIDPGVDEIVHAVDHNVDEKIHNGRIKHKPNSFRFTRMQRKKEVKTAKYKEINKELRKNSLIEGKSIETWESELSKHNLGTCIYSNLLKRLTIKNKISNIIYEFYQKEIFRKLKLNHYMNSQRSDANMINRFKERFGDPTETVVFMGDWSPNQGMRYKEPVRGKGIRRLFKRNGYDVYLIDEYNTSKMMCETGDLMEKFKKAPNREYKKEIEKNGYSDKHKTILVHGLLRNKLSIGIPCIDTVYFNRNVLGALNIREKGLCHLYNAPIPEYLSRKKRETFKKGCNSSDEEIEENGEEDMTDISDVDGLMDEIEKQLLEELKQPKLKTNKRTY